MSGHPLPWPGSGVGAVRLEGEIRGVLGIYL